MAVAGLHNVPVLDHSRSRWGDQDRPTTRASSLLQMWREIESDRLRQSSSERSNTDSLSTYLSQGPVSESGDNEVENEFRPCSQVQMGSQNDIEDGNSCVSEQSTDLSEVQRERVRQIFHEWVNNGGRSHAANVANGNHRSRAQWLGESECERVRIIREWVQRTSQQKGTSGDHGEEQGEEIGAQIEQIRDGVAVNCREIGSRKAIRRLCGRQTLLDLLMKADRERKRELQALSEHRPVSDFAHRNRIQSLLKVRFLRNDRSNQSQRPTSIAASELGLLRERHTVSGLREGFLSRLNNGIHGLVTSSESDGSSNNEISAVRIDELSEANDSREPPDEFVPDDGEEEVSLFDSENIGMQTSRDVNLQEPTAQGEETHGEVSGNEERDDTTSFQQAGRNTNVNDLVGCEFSLETSGIKGYGQDHIQASYEFIQEHPEQSGEVSDVLFASDLDSVETEIIQEICWQDTSVQVEELHESSAEIEGTDWQHLDSVQFSQWIDGAAEDEDEDWQEGTANNWYHETSENDDGEHSQLQELHEEWQEDGMQEALDDWLDGPSGRDIAPPRRFDAFLLSNDDNGYITELRELSSRRRVSNLLQSGFRESLDQLLQSNVERQAHASFDWEPDATSPSPALFEQDLEQSGNHNVEQSDPAGRIPVAVPSPFVTSSEEIWDQELLISNWPRQSLHQHSGMEWEIINDLRIDMARLQQRMNNMQRMLEACMDMQLELQRSVRQEVSAALNRSADSTDAVEDTLLKDESKWDHVRKGICCICSNGNIDSLLYRCGHMCTCSKCAEKLVQSQGKCPMCRAPVIEVIRAYSI